MLIVDANDTMSVGSIDRRVCEVQEVKVKPMRPLSMLCDDEAHQN
jgi:hypothetical protein